jgi:hypothetical protein
VCIQFSHTHHSQSALVGSSIDLGHAINDFLSCALLYTAQHKSGNMLWCCYEQHGWCGVTTSQQHPSNALTCLSMDSAIQTYVLLGPTLNKQTRVHSLDDFDVRNVWGSPCHDALPVNRGWLLPYTPAVDRQRHSMQLHGS